MEKNEAEDNNAKFIFLNQLIMFQNWDFSNS